MPKTPTLNRYILCQFVPNDSTGKTDKIPLNYKTLKAHSIQDPSIYTTYEAAKALLEVIGDNYGIGFVLLKEDKYFCIDIDNAFIGEQWSDLACELYTVYQGSYIEISNSKRGLHIIGRYEGDQPSHACKNSALGLELYTETRFIALAEINPEGSAETIHTDQLIQTINKYFIKTSEVSIDKEWTTESEPDFNDRYPNDDLKLIEYLLNKRPTPQESFGGIVSFKDLFEANEDVLIANYPTKIEGKPYDFSAADMALAYRLHYSTGRNCERVERIMRLSKLNRDKWDKGAWLHQTIINARCQQTNYDVHPREHQNITTTSPIVQQDLNLRLLQGANYPELNMRGVKPLDTSNNLKFMLDIFGIEVRWNNMARIREISIPNLSVFKEDEENFELNFIKDLALLNEMPITRIDEHLNFIAQKDSFHPIVEGLKINLWDGVPRLNQFIDTLETTNQELSYKLIRRWMISAIAAIHTDKGFSASGVLVLAGDQYIGKTQFIKNLDPFECNAVKTGALLDPTNKDCVRTLSEFWLAELGELDASFNKTDIARLKSFLTESVDKIRLPYARKDSILNRRTVFAATVNNPNFLIDETGNRRWWTIHVLEIDLNHGLDMTQVWAEVYHIWSAGEQSWMTQDEFYELNIHNKDHEQLNPLEEALHTFFDFSDRWEDKTKISYSATEVLRCIGYDKPTKAQCTQMGKILTKSTGIKPKRGRVTSRHELVLKTKTIQ